MDLAKHAFMKDVPYTRVEDSPTFTGTYGAVSQWKDAAGNIYAIKELRPTNPKTRSTDFSAMVANEIGLLTRCSHENILKFVDGYTVNTIPDSVFIVTRPWAPLTLTHLLQSIEEDGSSCCSWWNDASSDNRIYDIFSGLLNGVAHLHDQLIMHKDINPNNIVFDGPRPVITDFGISKIYKPGAPTKFMKSTFQYLAPEQIAHKESGLKADMFALGCCFLLVLTASSGGAGAIDQVLAIIEEKSGTFQYAKEVPRIMSFLQQFLNHIPLRERLLGILVRDLLLETPEWRLDSHSSIHFLASVDDHIRCNRHSRQARSVITFWNEILQPKFTIYEELTLTNRYMQLNYNPIVDHSIDLFVVPVSIVHLDRPMTLRATLDTMSHVNIISRLCAKRVKAHLGISTDIIDPPTQMHSISSSFEVREQVQLNLVMHSGQQIQATFLVLPAGASEFFEIIFGYDLMFSTGLIRRGEDPLDLYTFEEPL